MADEQELVKLKEKIDNARQELSKEQGVLESAQARLEELGVESVEEAEAKVEELGQEIERIERDLEAKIQEIQEGLGNG